MRVPKNENPYTEGCFPTVIQQHYKQNGTTAGRLIVHPDYDARLCNSEGPSDLHVGEEVIRAVESPRAVLDFLAAAVVREKEKGLSRERK